MKKLTALTLAIFLILGMVVVLPISAVNYEVVSDQDFTTFSTAATALTALKTNWNVGNFYDLTGATNDSIAWTKADGFKYATAWHSFSQISSKTALSNYRFTTKLRTQTTISQWAAIAVRESLTNGDLPAYGDVEGNISGKSAQGITFTLSGTNSSTTTTMSVIIRNSTSSNSSNPYNPDVVFTVPFPSSTANYFGIADRTIVIIDKPDEITFTADGTLIAKVTIDTTSKNADGSYNKGAVYDGSGTLKGTFSAADHACIPASGMIDIFQRNNNIAVKALKLEKEVMYTDLEAKIAQAQGYQESLYTAVSYAALSAKILAAQNLITRGGATLTEVNTAISDIDKAIFDLVPLAITQNGYTMEFLNNNVVTDRQNATDIRVTLEGNGFPILAMYEGDKLVKCSAGTNSLQIKFSEACVIKLMTFESDSNLKPIKTEQTVFSSINKVPNVQNFSVAGVFSDNMVLQRYKPISIFGTSTDADGKIITANLGQVYGYGIVQNGKWEIVLPAMSQNASPQILKINGAASTIDYSNILVGDVYFAAGQSNMEYAVAQSATAASALANAKDTDNIRIFYQNGTAMMALSETDARVLTPQQNPWNSAYKWEVANATAINKFSAVAYNFAKKIQDSTGANVPIGLIQTAVGGSSLAGNTPAEINAQYANGDFHFPSRVYNTMIAPVERFTAYSILWYQGESDSIRNEDVANYSERFAAFLNNWEQKNKGNLDVYSVQLSSHPSSTGWQLGKFRTMQMNMLNQIDNFYLAMTIDKGVSIGGDIGHPNTKKEVGDRLANIALMKRYFIAKNDALSPIASSITYGEAGATITFENVGTGLCTYNNEPIKGFELIKDGVAVEAQATITSPNTILVTGIANPVGVRYAYYCLAGPNMANVSNSNGLPLGTFADNTAQIAPISDGVFEGWDIPYKTVPASLGALGYRFDLSKFVCPEPAKGTLTFDNNIMQFAVKAKDAYLLHPAISVSSDNKFIKIRYKNTSNTQDFQIYWTTNVDTAYDQNKQTYISIEKNMNGFVDWYVDMSKFPNWKDTITGFRIDPLDSASQGSIFIESIELYGVKTDTLWTFEPNASDTASFANGWTALNQMSFAKENNNLKITISGPDAFMYKDALNVPTSIYKKIKIRYKNLSQGAVAEVFFGTTASPGITGTQRKGFAIKTKMTDFEDAIFDMTDASGWTTYISSIRLDLANGSPNTNELLYVQSIEFIQ